MAPPTAASKGITNTQSFFKNTWSTLTGEEPEPEVEMNSLEKAWANATATAKNAAKSAQESGSALAATAGISIPTSLATLPSSSSSAGAWGGSGGGDDENLVGGAAGAAGEITAELGGLCPSLTYKQRVMGAASCLALGLVIDLFATMALFMGRAHVADYAILYTLGNMTAICGSGFLVGPARQAKVMCEPVRRVACTIYLCTMVATVVVAVTVGNILLIFAMLVVQYTALIWYGASFIPFARTCIIKACKTAGTACKKSVGLDEL